MIDLKEKSATEQNEAEAPVKSKSFDKEKEANAKKFLSVMLAIIVAFVGIVCIFVHKRNETLLAQQKIDAATKAPATQAPQAADSQSQKPQNSNGNTTPEDTAPPSAGITLPEAGSLDSPTIIEIDDTNRYLTLVNVGYRVPQDYKPDLLYVCNSGERLETTVAQQYEKMYEAALNSGVTLTPCSGYISYETQERSFSRKAEFYEAQGLTAEEARLKASTTILPAGASEHNLGYAMDIVCTEEWFETSKEFKWLQANAASYGFTLRYPKNKQDITGSAYKPWHWRYVGVETAKALKASGITLEEYLGVTQ